VNAPRSDTLAARLSPKEAQCLSLVLDNRSSKAIGRQLGISHTSVDTHVRRALAKLGLHDRYEAARLLALEAQPVPAPEPLPAEPALPRRLEPLGEVRDLIPPLERLGLGHRVGLVVAAALVLALVFGVVANALRTL
jgi:DNA-binding CsgD family transcriptional regulator